MPQTSGKMGVLVQVVLVVGALFLSATRAQAEMVLVGEGVEPCPICFRAQGDPLEETAAKQLAAYLGRLSGATFSTSKLLPNSKIPDRAVLIGAPADDSAKDLPADGFRIVTQGQQLHISGGNARGTLYGVFALLEKHFGCRWWSHGEEDVPTGNTRLVVAELDETTRPAFSIHNVWNREAQSPQGSFAYKLRTTSWESFDGGHSLYPLLEPYAKQHSEIYPQDKTGQRKHNLLHFCYLAPGIAEALTEALAARVEARKRRVDDVIYFAGMGDWYGGQCECDACKKVYEEEAWVDPDGRRKPGYTGTLLRMINRTAEQLEARYPKIRIGTFAYMSLEAPPAKTVPRENVVIRVPRLRHCGVHPARSCEKNASFARNVQRWCELAPGRVHVWEYGANFTNLLGPYPCLTSMSDNLRYYHEHGIAGVEIQGNYVSFGGDLAVLKNYVWAKLMWEPNRDSRALVAEFCDGYYGPAAGVIERYVDLLEGSVVEPQPLCADEFAPFPYLTPTVRTQAELLRREALDAVSDHETYRRRVLEATANLEAERLWKAGPLEERDGRLVRTDVEGDSLARAQELLKYTRGGAPSEFSIGRSPEMNLLALQGGPLVTLAQGDVKVHVAALLNGQIRQFTFRDRPLLHVETNWRVRGYPRLGGSIEGFDTRLMELDGAPTETLVRLKGEAGIGAFSPATKQWIARTLELLPDGSLRSSATIRRAVAKGSETRSVKVTTVYALGIKQSPRVEAEMADDTWRALAVASDGTPCDVANPRALRISLPNQACRVEDRYLDPPVAGATISYDPKIGTLTVIVESTPVEAPLDEERRCFVREFRVAPQ